jgi:hypothetical protein
VYHLSYVVRGFLEMQKDEKELRLEEDGSFPPDFIQQRGWFNLFEKGLVAEGDKGDRGMRRGDNIPARPQDDDKEAYDAWKSAQKSIVDSLRRQAKNEPYKNSVVELCKAAEPAGTIIPWKSLLPREDSSPAPKKRHEHGQGSKITLFGPASYLHHVCESDESCKWKDYAGLVSFATGTAHCRGGPGCKCAEGQQDLIVDNFVGCSWSRPMSPKVDADLLAAVPYWIPEDKVNIKSGGIKVAWIEKWTRQRTEHDKKPDRRCGKRSPTKQAIITAKGQATRALNKKKKQEKEASEPGKGKKKAPAEKAPPPLLPVRQSDRTTKGQNSKLTDFVTADGDHTPEHDPADGG